jgi:hypothetical protein
MVLRYVGAVAVDGACVRVPVPREAVGPDGIITDPESERPSEPLSPPWRGQPPSPFGRSGSGPGRY